MSLALARLRRGLAPRYEVETELASGGMSLVYRARDTRLGRDVAIKVLRPEFATAIGAERFLREANLLARLTHPNVLQIHDAGEADGLLYYVMDLHEGATLSEALAAGPLPAERALELADDLLAALQAVHGLEVVHRDVKPSNIFLAGERALLADFGVARLLDDSGEPLTVAGAVVGTPEYMSPEQAAGGTVSPRSDLYSAAAVLYRALTGRRWRMGTPPGDASWEGIPRALRPALARALEPDPEARWPDAASFRRALHQRGPAGPWRRWGVAGAAAALLIAGAVIVVLARGPDRGPPTPVRTYDLAFLPCETTPPSDSAVGQNLTRLVAFHLEKAPGVEVVRQATADRWWWAAREGGAPGAAEAASALGARFAARCELTVARGSLSADLTLQRAEGGAFNFLPAVRTEAENPPVRAADRAVLEILRHLPGIPHVSSDALGSLADHPMDAVIPFLWGERAFSRNARVEAERHYVEAVTADPTLAIARWRLADVRRWLSSPPGIDLDRLYREHGDDLGTVDRLLLEARLEPHGPEQWAAYQSILERYPRDAYVTLIYADELLHRGPLWGIELDSAVTVLRLAARRDSFLAPTYEHLVLAAVRLGNRTLAEDALERLEAFAARDPRSTGDLLHPALLRQAFLERFEPDLAGGGGDAAWAREPGLGPRQLYELVRFVGPYVDLADAQTALARRLREAGGPEPSYRVSGHLAEALALWTSGRCGAALLHFDSAAALEGSTVARLDAAAWRTLPRALGSPCGTEAAAREGRRVLVQIAADTAAPPSVRRQAVTLLGLGDGGAGEEADPERWLREIRGIPLGEGGSRRSETLLEAARLARAGRAAAALERSHPLLERDSAGLRARPFERALVYGLRARWQEELGRWEEARRTWLWTLNSDLIGIPGSRVQSGDVDWALSSFAGLRRAEASSRAGRPDEACRVAGEVLRAWREPDPELAGALDRARRLAAQTCPSAETPGPGP